MSRSSSFPTSLRALRECVTKQWAYFFNFFMALQVRGAGIKQWNEACRKRRLQPASISREGAEKHSCGPRKCPERGGQI